MQTAGIKELKNRLTYYLREVRKGEKILVTDRKKVIATIVPAGRSAEDAELFSLIKEGLAIWRGGKPAGSMRPVRIKGKTLSEIVLEDRR